MADERDEIRARIDIVQLVGQRVPLKRAGKHWKGLCPFHNDKNPSFTVSSDTGRYRCWSCGEAGDIFNWVMKTQNVEFVDALRILADQAGVTLSQGQAAPKGERDQMKAAMQAAQAFFREQLTKSANARDYVDRRGLDQATIDEWQLGYAPDVGEALAIHLKKAGFPLPLCASLFLVKEDAGGGFFDSFRGRLMFPIHDDRGELVAFGGRLLGDGHPKYINSSDTPIYRKSRLLYGMNIARETMHKERRAVLVEGYLDVIACHRAGVKTAVASLGTSLTDEHAKLLKRWADEVTILYDSDSAGQKAAERAVEILRAESLRIKIALMPEGQDPDTLLKTSGPQAVQRSVDAGLLPLEFQIRAVERRLGPGDPAFWEEVVPLLAAAPVDMELDKHITRLASLYPDVRDPVQAQKALRRWIGTSRKRGGGRAPEERPRISFDTRPVQADLAGPELAIFGALLAEETQKEAWEACADPGLFLTTLGTQMATAVRASFPDAAPQGLPAEWLHRIEPEELRNLFSDVGFDLRTSHITPTYLSDARLELERQSETRKLASLQQEELTDEQRVEILNRLRRLNPGNPPKDRGEGRLF